MQSKPMRGAGRAGRFLLGAVALCAALAACAVPAAAAPTRPYVSQISGFVDPEAVTVGVGDDVWISDVNDGVLSKYGPYPSQEKIGEQTSGGTVWGGGYLVHSLAESAANEFLYTGIDNGEGAACGGAPFAIFDNFGDLYLKERPPGNPCQMWVAVDNDPRSDSYGRYYLFTNSGPSIALFDGYGNPVDFSGKASYISGNEITGTPKGPFSGRAAGGFSPEMSGITVDPTTGNIWMIENGGYYEPSALSEFNSEGIFIRRVTEKSAGVPRGNTPAGYPKFGAGPGLTGIAVDPTNGHVLVSDKARFAIEEFSPQGKYLGQIDGSETPAGTFGYECYNPYGTVFCYDHVMGIAVNSQGYLYAADGENHVVDVFGPAAPEPKIEDEASTGPTSTSGTVNATVDPNGAGDITACKVEYGTSAEFERGEFGLGSITCTPDPSASHFSAPTAVHAEISGLTAEETYHYRFVVTTATTTRIGEEETLTPHAVIGLRADPATGVTASSATLHGSFVGNGADTHYWFEYGTNTGYGTKLPLPAPPGADAGSPAGPQRTSEQVDLTGLKPVTRYHYRIVADNGSTSRSEDQSFRTEPVRPEVRSSISDVHSDRVSFNVGVNPGGADTVYTLEYGLEPCSTVTNPCQTPYPLTHIGSNLSFDSARRSLEGLQPGTIYHYRVIATNSVGTTYGADRTFSTYPFSSELKDSCPNALARQQTGTALVTDCRAYELVSANHAGGYDVESTLVPGQTPFEGYPLAQNPSRVLYGVHNGAIPGVAGDPTNRGVDPYVATRGDDGWTTAYVGIPADDPNATAPFSSTLAEADPGLDSFAFGGSEICSPCFGDGSTGVPLRLPDGSLVQGMKGSQSQPNASQDGLVERRFSADGSHFVFSSTAQFEPAGNDETGDVSVYERDLASGRTQVVSSDEAGAPLACLQGAGTCHAPGDAAGIAELDISANGSRVLIGQKVSTDANGNDYYRLYMHIGESAASVALTPGATSGVLFDGMTEDGSKVFFTTRDHLLAADTDASADIYEAEVDAAGHLTLSLVSVAQGGPSNDDGCEPPGTPTAWNAAPGEAGQCSAVALAGGAGLATQSGTFYFLSPELLDSAAQSEGEEGQPNLYVVEPGGKPQFVAMIDTSVGKPAPPPATHPRLSGSFLSGLSAPESLAVDQSNGDLYVAERESASVSRYTSTGAPDDFTTGPDAGTNQLTGQSLGGGGKAEIAVDNAPGAGPLARALYVTSDGHTVSVYAPSGEQLGELTGFGEACGVAVDQSNGDVYVGDYLEGAVWRFEPSSPSGPIDNSDYVKTGIFTEGVSPCMVSADSAGHVFAMGYGGGALREYLAAEFSPVVSPTAGSPVNGASSAFALYADPANADRYADLGSRIVWLDASNEVLGQFGSGELSASRGVAFDSSSRHVYVSSGSEVIAFGFQEPTYQPIDNPAVLHGLGQAATHSYGDFQVTPSGSYAAFTTTRPLDSSFENLGFSEVYRYDAGSGALDCVSCSPTNALATGAGQLAPDGLSLTDDGRVFFNSTEPLVLRDGDSREDVYEWEARGAGNCGPTNPNFFPTEICLSLVSSGTSPFNSSLLSASANGTDAFFFTHDTLALEDENGPVTKIYDARTDGGFFKVPPPAPCAASDECHGPGTKAATPPPIRTTAGTAGNHSPTTHTHRKRCKRGFVRKHGKCVRRKHRAHRKHRAQKKHRRHRKATHRHRHG